MVNNPHQGKKNLIQDWLEELQTPKIWPVDEGYLAERGLQKTRSRAQSARPSPDDWKLQVPQLRDATGSLSGTREGRQRQRPRRGPDEDSSIIAPIDDHHRVRDRVKPHSLCLSDTEECYYERGKKRQQTVSEAGSLASGALAHADHRFEKRARRKTRDDRYNTLSFDAAGRERKSKKKDGKQNKKKGDVLSSAREVMSNFSSNSILNDRLTMNPSLRPGLFDNGRTSKNQLPDLTFREMAFLKQPRRESLRPISRSREKERRRSERELEEVSAFFLHKNLPETFDASGRKQTAVSGLSKLDEVIGNSPAYKSGPRQHEDVSSSDHINNRYFKDQPESRVQMPSKRGREREDSGATTCFTWSASHHSSGAEFAPTSEVPEGQQERSSTPIPVREALAHTGIFANTGIHSVASCQRHDKLDATRFKDKPSKPKSPEEPGAYTVKAGHEVQNPPVRIIRYQDRGTMANQDEECTADNGGKSWTPCDPTHMQEEIPHSKDHPSQKGSAAVLNSMGQTTANQSVQRSEVGCPENPGVGAGIPSFEEQNGTGLKRPKSPKWAIIEQLEAAAEDGVAQDIETHATAGRMAPNTQHNSHAAADRYKHSVSEDHEPPMQGVPISGHGRPDRPDPLYVTETDRQQDQNVLGELQGHIRREQSNHRIPLGPVIPAQHTQIPLEGVDYPPLEYSLVRSPDHGAPTGPSAQRYAAMYSNDFVGRVPQLQDDTIKSIITSHVQRKPILSRGDDVLLQDISHQQNMQDYIAQLEQDILSRPHEEDGGGGSPSLNQNGMQEYGVENFSHIDSQEFQHHVDDSGYIGELWDTPLRNQALSRVSLRSWVDTRNMKDEEEEQRFTSTFWRPNRYPI